MHFEIRRALQRNQQLTARQRTSSHFAEEPRIGAYVLRRGLPPLRLNERQFAVNMQRIKLLFHAGAIDVFACRGDTKEDMREAIRKCQDENGITDLHALHKVLPNDLYFARDELQSLASGDSPPNEYAPDKPTDAQREAQENGENAQEAGKEKSGKDPLPPPEPVPPAEITAENPPPPLNPQNMETRTTVDVGLTPDQMPPRWTPDVNPAVGTHIPANDGAFVPPTIQPVADRQYDPTTQTHDGDDVVATPDGTTVVEPITVPDVQPGTPEPKPVPAEDANAVAGDDHKTDTEVELEQRAQTVTGTEAEGTGDEDESAPPPAEQPVAPRSEHQHRKGRHKR